MINNTDKIKEMVLCQLSILKDINEHFNKNEIMHFKDYNFILRKNKI